MDRTHRVYTNPTTGAYVERNLRTGRYYAFTANGDMIKASDARRSATAAAARGAKGGAK